MEKKMKRELAGLIAVVSAITFFSHSYFYGQSSPFRGDIPLQFYPWKCYTYASLASGEIPYWNPYTFAGSPFLANVQSAVFYPFDFGLFLFPLERFFGLSLYLHLVWAGIGAYLFARLCKATPLPSAVAGIAYGLNGFTMIHIPAGNHLTYAGAAWIPWMMAFTAGFVLTKKSRLPWALAGTLTTFFHFLCGHPQMMFYSLFFSSLFCLCLGWWNEKCKTGSNRTAAWIRTGAWCLFLLFGIAMAGLQLMPTLEYMGLANRAARLDVMTATEFSFAPHRLITLVCPEFFGTFIRGTHYDSFVYWSCAYAGVLVPFLAILSFFKGRTRYVSVLPLVLVAIAGLLLAWGRGNPIYTLVYQLPGFGYFRAPAKYLPYYLVSVCVLAALGIECLCIQAYEKLQRETWGNAQKYKRCAIVLSLLLVVLGLVVFYGMPFAYGLAHERIFSMVQSICNGNVELFSTQGMGEIQKIAWLERIASLLRFGLIFALGIVVYLCARMTPVAPRLVITGSLGFVLFLDLYGFGQNYIHASLQSVETIRQASLYPGELGIARSSRNQPIPQRIMNLKDVDQPNVFMHWRLYNIAGYDPMSLRSYNRLMGKIENWEEGSYHDNIQLLQYNHPLLDLLNVRYVITRKEIHDPTLKQRTAGSSFRVYERLSPTRSWSYILDSAGQWQAADAKIQCKKYAPHEIVFSYDSQQSVTLRVSEWYYPGWKGEAVLQRGEVIPLPIASSQEGFRTFTVPPSTKEIRLSYHPSWKGWILSSVAGVLLIMLVLFSIVVHTDWFLFKMQRIMGRDF